MRVSLRTFALLALLLPLGGTLAAQHRGLRQIERDGGGDNGFWVIVGVAQGQERFKFDTDPEWSDHFNAGSLMLGAGGMLSPDLGLGFEWNIWADYEAESDQKLQALSLVANWYPGGSMVFLKGGLGLGFNRIDDASSTFTDSGVGITVGAGIDIPVSRSIAIQPRIDHYIQRYDDDGQDNDYREKLTQIGVAIRFR